MGFLDSKKLAKISILAASIMAKSILAQTITLVGGGGALPVSGYAGNTNHRQITAPSSGSLFFALADSSGGTIAVSYCLTGSQAGKNILSGGVINSVSYNVQNTCQDGSSSVTGFGAASAGRSDLNQPSFAGTDVPLASEDYADYLHNMVSSNPVQFPSVASAIAIAFKPRVRKDIDLTSSQLCGIYSGKLTDWSQLAVSESGAINIVYRSDSSASTLALMNHLASVCGFSSPDNHFRVNQDFSIAIKDFLPVIPSNWIPAEGASGVVAATLNDPNAITYVGYGDAVSAGLDSASIDFSPPAGFGEDIPVDVVYNKAMATGEYAANGAAVLEDLSPGLATQCIALVDPSTYADRPGKYPIISISYLLANSNGNGADTRGVQNLLDSPFNPVSFTVRDSAFPRIGPGTGLAFLTNADMIRAKIFGCIVD